MNVYQKLAEARKRLKSSGLKQSGKNKGVGYTYFDLSDILPKTTEIEQELGLLSVVTFTETTGELTVFNAEQPAECIKFTSPLKPAELRGCHPVQNLGASETYVRRYLYLLAYEIVETEALDLTQLDDVKPPKREQEPRRGQTDDKNGETLQNSNNADRESAGSKARQIAELIKGTDVQPEQVTEFIIANFGKKLKVNDLTDEQFKKLYTAIGKYIKGDEE